ncbi:hypothetical protein BJ138DRAFT_591476 [Hygrophoropsis aurantiaca]|uniref:Uncharacterized protein n=1 Tax=Hygrophoropsis aurantiaca TaxID=72124 RepID=A0ACB8A110_9AGAM|nr:hypothetical protein BJ138DRAFT_591476 [Hygrophoropsis aurantiaca]
MSFTSSSSTIYNNRRDSGLYDATVDQAIALPKGTAMSHATYKTDFTRASQPQSSNFSYKKVGSNVDKEMIVFGQIAPAVLGTKLTAIGDHYIGDDDRPFLIEDKTRVKFVFALCEPSKSPKRMATLFHNQIATLDQLIDTTEEELEGQPKVNFHNIFLIAHLTHDANSLCHLRNGSVTPDQPPT